MTMLKSLSVRNYALITSLDVEFREGLNMITGETGAGKSILVGALGLLLGNRADTSVLREKDTKCQIEAAFLISGIDLKHFFSDNDLDYEESTTIRREITPQGKSRAFINDTPVTLNVLRDLTVKLVDIHSQHQVLLLSDPAFALHVVDQYGLLAGQVNDYRSLYNRFRNLEHRLSVLKAQLNQARADQDYLEFQVAQLDQAALKPGELESLEAEQELHEHAVEIMARLGETVQALHESEDSVETRLKQVIHSLESVAGYLRDLGSPVERLQSVYLEIQEASRDLNQMLGRMETDPERLAWVVGRLDLIHDLLRKHQSGSIGELLELGKQYRERLGSIALSDEEVRKGEAELGQLRQEITRLGILLREARKVTLSDFEGKVVELIRELGMPGGSFKALLEPLDEFSEEGMDAIRFLFSANKNMEPEELSRVASGGETSRLMLSVKSLVSGSLAVPTVIFDEIDSGVSGEIADKVGNLIARLSVGRQILNITHLPQVASKGDHHYLVYKYEDNHTTHTSIRLLDPEERILELAKMLSGEKVTREALENARVLLKR